MIFSPFFLSPHIIVCMETRGACHNVALPFTFKSILRLKEELWKFKYFTMQKYNLQKNPLKETKMLQDIITLL
jgi:hypothetical protein